MLFKKLQFNYEAPMRKRPTSPNTFSTPEICKPQSAILCDTVLLF